MKNTILIIKDDKDIREGIRTLLEGEVFLVDEASNGMEGIKKLSPETNMVIRQKTVTRFTSLLFQKEGMAVVLLVYRNSHRFLPLLPLQRLYPYN